MTFSSLTEARLRTLIPPAQEAAREYLEHLRGLLPESIRIEIVSATRTAEEQNALYEQGRTTAGSIVTRARAWQSNHNFGIAWDIGLFNDDGYIDSLVEAGKFSRREMGRLYAMVGKAAHECDLHWGGDWTSDDEPHIEWYPPWAEEMDEHELMAGLQQRHRDGEPLA